MAIGAKSRFLSKDPPCITYHLLFYFHKTKIPHHKPIEPTKTKTVECAGIEMELGRNQGPEILDSPSNESTARAGHRSSETPMAAGGGGGSETGSASLLFPRRCTRAAPAEGGLCAGHTREKQVPPRLVVRW